MSDLSLPFRPAATEAPWLRISLIVVVVSILGVLLFAPLIAVFYEALRKKLAPQIAATAGIVG